MACAVQKVKSDGPSNNLFQLQYPQVCIDQLLQQPYLKIGK